MDSLEICSRSDLKRTERKQILSPNSNYRIGAQRDNRAATTSEKKYLSGELSGDRWIVDQLEIHLLLLENFHPAEVQAAWIRRDDSPLPGARYPHVR